MQNRHVLVVDDDRDAVSEITEVLAEMDWIVGSACNAAAGLQAISDNPDLDVVVADLFMDGMSGFDLMAECHSMIRPGLPFILMTGYPSYELAVRSIRTSAADFVEKPISFDDLAKALDRAVAAKARFHWAHQQPSEVVADLIKLRSGIQRVLSPALSSDPCLDLLLHLSQVESAARLLPISAACAASGVPMTTALRRIAELVERGLIERQDSDSDRRSSFLRLTEKGRLQVAEIVRAAQAAVAETCDPAAAPAPR